MLKRFAHLFAFLAATILLTACAATGPSALNPRSEVTPSLERHGAVLLSLSMDNKLDPKWGPWKLGGRFTGKVYDVEKQQEVTVESSLTYYPMYGVGTADEMKSERRDMTAIVILPAGRYRITSIVGAVKRFLLVSAIHFPVFSDEFVVDAGKGIYLGHIGIVAEEKTAPDQLSIDAWVGRYPGLGQTTSIAQATSGIGKATPVLTLSNRFEDSVKEIKKDYPYLKDVPFTDRPLNVSLTRK